MKMPNRNIRRDASTENDTGTVIYGQCILWIILVHLFSAL